MTRLLVFALGVNMITSVRLSISAADFKHRNKMLFLLKILTEVAFQQRAFGYLEDTLHLLETLKRDMERKNSRETIINDVGETVPCSWVTCNVTDSDGAFVLTLMKRPWNQNTSDPLRLIIPVRYFIATFLIYLQIRDVTFPDFAREFRSTIATLFFAFAGISIRATWRGLASPLI